MLGRSSRLDARLGAAAGVKRTERELYLFFKRPKPDSEPECRRRTWAAPDSGPRRPLPTLSPQVVILNDARYSPGPLSLRHIASPRVGLIVALAGA